MSVKGCRFKVHFEVSCSLYKIQKHAIKDCGFERF